MSPLVAALLGLLVGGLLTSVVMVSLTHRAARPHHLERPDPMPGYRAIIGHLRSAAALVGPHDEVLEANPTAQARGVVRGERLAVPAILALAREARAESELRTTEVQIARGGVAAPHDFAVRAVPLEGGVVVVLADDRTEALRLDATRRDFVANVTHELKTPIGAISLLSEAIGAANDDPASVVRFNDKLAVEAQRLNDLVSQIITLSRVQSSDPLLVAEAVDIDAVIDVAVARCHALAEGRQVELTTAARERGVEVWGVASQVETAVVNLVQNAITYSDPGAHVTVGSRLVTEGEDDVVDIAVSDNGIGIAEADQPRLFERFFRVDYGRSRENGGTGLGLSLVKHIAEAHGGSVRVWSRLGQGSTFTLRLPAHAAEPPNATGKGEPR